MSVNRNSFLHDLIQLAGGLNMTANAPMTYPRISVEEVIDKRPEVILISSMERGGAFEAAKRQWRRWTPIPAVKNGRIHLVDSDLIDRPSPRIIEGLRRHSRQGWSQLENYTIPMSIHRVLHILHQYDNHPDPAGIILMLLNANLFDKTVVHID